MDVITYNNINSLKSSKSQSLSQIDINSPNYLYKFVDELLKKKLTNLKQGKLKPFKLSLNRNLIIIQFPPKYDVSIYDKWYDNIETVINQVFYRKESDNDVVPDSYQRHRLYTTINDTEFEINGNVVIKSMPIYQPKPKKTKLTTSAENIEAIKNKGEVKPKKPKYKCMYIADESDEDE